MKILGVMTGTSCDGLDAACISVDGEGWEPLWNAEAPYPAALRKRVLAFQERGAKHGAQDWLALHRDLGEWYGTTLAKIIAAHPSERERPEVIANHGQTVAHYPAAKRQGTTLQLGDPSRIAYHTGLTVISHFRDGDMAAGGQGAPLLPLFHQLLAGNLGGGGIAIHNIGGISNLSYIAADESVMALDTGPGNIFIDAATQKATRGRQNFDKDGELGAKGKVNVAALKQLIKHPYYRKAAPKSTGRDDFPVKDFLKTRAKGADLVATATALTVETIGRAYEQSILNRGLPLRAIFVSGGGAKNATLMEWLQMRLPEIRVAKLSEEGFDGQLIEAQGFACFAYLALLGKPIGGAWTGVSGFGPPAQITPGENWEELISLRR